MLSVVNVLHTINWRIRGLRTTAELRGKDFVQHLQPAVSGGGRANQIEQEIKDDSIVGQTCRLAASPGPNRVEKM